MLLQWFLLQGNTPLQVWSAWPYYYPLHVIQMGVACVYYGVTIRVSMGLCDPMYYTDKRQLVKRGEGSPSGYD